MKFKDTPEAKPLELASRLGEFLAFIDINLDILYRVCGNSIITLREELYKAAEAIKLSDAEFEDAKKRYPKLKRRKALEELEK